MRPMFVVIALTSGQLAVSPGAAPPEAVKPTLTFDNEMAAIVYARRWDETQQQWMDEREGESPLFFDAVHRFLLLRYPGCAEAIRDKLAAGHRLVSAKLLMQFEKQEWMRAGMGYQHRSWPLKGKPVDQWHGQVWLLRRPWVADATHGPTWNAYVNGAGYWKAGGGWDAVADRSAEPLGQTLLSEQHPAGEIDVTAAFGFAEHGSDLGARLRDLEACGFLVQKAELCGPHHGEWALSTGNARLWITEPRLVVTFAQAPPRHVALPPRIDIEKLAADLRRSGAGGKPTTALPGNLRDLADQARLRRPAMPVWMEERVLEVRRLETLTGRRGDLGFTIPDDLESGDMQRYTRVVTELLRHPPGYFRGHSHLDFMLPLQLYGDMLPDVLRHHLLRYFEARWLPPYSEGELRHRVGYWGGMATLNHQSQFRSEALLVAELLGMEDLELMARRNISLLNRQMLYSEGTIQERGDSFYLGISLGTLQMVARFSRDPLMRLKTSLAVEKILFESNTTYHPGLRRRVSRISRRYRLDDLLMAQAPPRGILHTLSRKGVLIQTDTLGLYPDPVMAARRDAGEKLTAEQERAATGLPTLNFHATAPVRVALLAPWGAEWEHNTIDNKPLPFWTVATDHVRHRMQPPVHNMTYLGTHYGLSCMDADIGCEWPVLAAWKRTEADVQRLEDLGILFPWPYLNGKLVNGFNQQEPTIAKRGCPQASVQHHNKMIHVVRPIEKVFAADAVRGGITSFSSRIVAFMYDRSWELWINGARTTSFPTTARQGDVITLGDGVSYVGLVPLPATDLGRDVEVEVRYTFPRLEFESFVLRTDHPLPNEDATWGTLHEATAGWIVELGDKAEHGSFERFRTHVQAAVVDHRWDAAGKVLHVGYHSGPDMLELGVSCMYVRTQSRERYIKPRDLLAYVRVNGSDPRPPIEIDIDSPIGQMGTGARLEKGGAVLESAEGQMALLKVEPVTGTYEAINPFIDPTPFCLTTPEGAMLRSDGPIGCARITVRPKENRLWIDYHIPGSDGAPGVERLQEESRTSATWLQRFFRQGVDVRRAREQSARFLLIAGLGGQPTVELNGRALGGPFPTVDRDGRRWSRIRIAEEL